MNLKHPKRGDFEEVVLEDGRFARIRRITVKDWSVAWTASKNEITLLEALLAVQTVTIDGEALTMDAWLDADWEFVAPIRAVISRMFAVMNANPNKGGVA